MKALLHAAISMDGFIAKTDGDSDWVLPIDNELFEKRIAEAGCIVVGRKTFEQFQGSLYPVKNVCNIVLTSTQQPDQPEQNIFFASSPGEALELAKEKGFEKVLIAGGGQVNGSFLTAGLLNEIYLSVYPFIMGEGIKLFEGVTNDFQMNLAGSRNMGEGLVELHYMK